MTLDSAARAYYTKVLNLTNVSTRPQVTACCPFHGDRRKSLSVNLDTGLWKCHAGCGSGNRAQFQTRRNSDPPESLPAQPAATALAQKVVVSLRRQVEAEYIYFSAEGKPVFRKVRLPGKRFLQERNERGKWASGLEGITARPLYNLLATMAAKNIAFAEGEKDVDNLTRFFKKMRMRDWAATTNFDGAGKPWHPEYDAPLKGKNVWVLADNDEIGRKHAQTYASAIERIAARVSLIEFSDLSEHGDVSDFLDQHPSRELRALLKSAPVWKDPLQSLFLTAPELIAANAEKVPWIVKDFVLRGSCSMLQAEPKMGKSVFTLTMVKHKIEGKPFLDRPTVAGPVVYLTEMSQADMKRELTDCGLAGAANLHILSIGKAWGLTWQQNVDLAAARCRMVNAEMLVIDTFHEWTQNEKQDDAGAVMASFRPLVPLMEDGGIAIWIETHERKSGGSIAVAGRGSNVLAAKASVIVSLRRPEGNHPPSYRKIEVVGRHGRFEETDRWENGEYVVLGKTASVIEESLTRQLLAKLPRSKKDAWDLGRIMAETKAKRSTVRGVLKNKSHVILSRKLHPDKKLGRGNGLLYWIEAEPPTPAVSVKVGARHEPKY
jgi:hypothetical protein